MNANIMAIFFQFLVWILAVESLLKNLSLTVLVVHIAFWLCIASQRKKGWPIPAASSLFFAGYM
jgi:hypothetical protein